MAPIGFALPCVGKEIKMFHVSLHKGRSEERNATKAVLSAISTLKYFLQKAF